MPCKEEEDHRSTKVPLTGRSMLRISEGFTKFAIKREQKHGRDVSKMKFCLNLT